MNITEVSLVHNQKKNCCYDHIPFKLEVFINLVLWPSPPPRFARPSQRLWGKIGKMYVYISFGYIYIYPFSYSIFSYLPDSSMKNKSHKLFIHLAVLSNVSHIIMCFFHTFEKKTLRYFVYKWKSYTIQYYPLICFAIYNLFFRDKYIG